MSTSAVLDVGIGLIFLYLVLSLICTTANEFIASIASLRARTLSSAVTRLIDDPALLKMFRDHGLIDATKTAAKGQPSYLAGNDVALALLSSLAPNSAMPSVPEVVQGMKNLPDSNVRDALLSAATTAGDDMSKVRDQIASWFDQSMDRVSGIYKRYMQWISLAVGLLLAVGLNVDTIVVAKSLWSDGSLRAGIVALTDKSIPGSGTPDAISQGTADLSQFEDKLRPFPIGWSSNTIAPSGSFLEKMQVIVIKIAGLLITGLALSLGAPFWFDLLSKFMNVRATGLKPGRT